MAKILYTAAVGDARGKLGGTVFSTGRYGSFLQQTPLPRNPHSEPQGALRRHMKMLGWRWSYWLTQDQRDAWCAWALTMDFTDVFIHTYNLTGWGIFAKVNQTLKLVSAPLLDDHPADLACGSPDGATLVIAGSPPTLVVHVTTDPAANERAYLAAVRPLSPGATYLGNLSRKVKTFGAGVAHPYDITTVYTDRYGPLQSGQVIHALVNFISQDTGGQGTPAIAKEVVP